MPDHHKIARLRLEAFDPDRRVIVGSEGIALIDVGVDQSTPVGCLAGPRPVRMNHLGWHAELHDPVMSHTGNVLDTLLGELPFMVLILGIRLPVLHQV